MSVQPSSAVADIETEIPARALERIAPDDLAPLRAGMRARAIADACERLELPAVLIDASGRVLHACRHAVPHLEGAVRIVADHLVGRTPRARRAVGIAVEAALGTRMRPADRSAAALEGVPYRDRSSAQLLRGIVVLGRRGRDRDRRMAALRDLLAAEPVPLLNALDARGRRQ